MKKKYTQDELFKMDAIEVYKLVLTKGIGKFPDGFWLRPDALENAKKCTKFLIEDILNLSEEEVKEKLNTKIFKSNKLYGMLSICFEGSSYKAIVNTYPERNYKVWEFKCTPKNHWTKENGIQATRWLIETKLKLTEEQLKEQLSQRLFVENNLCSMLAICFNSSHYNAIKETYPERNYKPWYFKQVPNGYWTKDTGIEATKWLIETELKLTEEELKERVSTKLFEDNNLGGMLQYSFNNSPYQAISETYPEKNYKPWEFSIVPKGYWTKKTGIEATKWLIETKLQLNDEQLKEKLSVKLFRDNNLSAMLAHHFNGSPYECINETYPERNYKPWEFSIVPKGYWNKTNGVLATKWLIETKLQLTDSKLKECLSANLFKENGLGGMLEICFNNSPFNAVNTAYPNKFRKEDFSNRNYYKD